MVWITQQRITAGKRQETDRHVDQKDPAPRVGVGYPAAQGWADDRRDQHREAKQRHRDALLFDRKRVEQYALAARLQTAARQPLHHTEQNELTEASGQSA